MLPERLAERDGRPLDYLLPRAVLEGIRARGMYGVCV